MIADISVLLAAPAVLSEELDQSYPHPASLFATLYRRHKKSRGFLHLGSLARVWTVSEAHPVLNVTGPRSEPDLFGGLL
jgi:hypothetical protein